MPNHDFLLTDDAVAERLISEANDDSSRGSAVGLESRRARPENKPKPNTRFLRNIIRTTENHNAALLAKEAAESQARLQELRETELRERRRHRPEPHEVRRRQMRDISAILRGGYGKKPIAMPASSSTGGISRDSLGRRKGDGSDGEDHDMRSERRSREYRSDSRRRRAKRASHSRERDHRRERHRSRSPSRGQRHRHRSRERSPLGGNGRERHDRRQGSHHERRTRGSSRSKSPRDYNRKRSVDDRTEDSDSLADMIGPLPPSLPTRGRGNMAHASGIDARFSESYDPASDVTYRDISAEAGSSTESGGRGGWDDMAEAYRDRQKWKAQGAERLRAAGFTETQIQNWGRGAGAGRGDDGDTHTNDLCWAKKGELRQWDRGKTVNPDGSVSTGPDWAKERL
ncbi:hypothetical protein RB595_005073 [Gaeumannomyces hyphopodioides]